MKIFTKTSKILFTVALIMTFSTSFTSVHAENDEDDVLYLSNNNSSSDYVGITVDGSYGDWDDKPHTKIQYPWDANNNYHEGALFRDENYVYLHIKMSNKSYTQFNGNNYIFTFDGTPYSFQVEIGELIYQKNKNFSNYLLEVHNQNGYALVENAGGTLTRWENGPNQNADENAFKTRDEWEIKIPLSFFTSNPSAIKTITFYCSNLGPQELIATGTPTLPFVVAGAGLVFASIGLGLSKRKRK